MIQEAIQRTNNNMIQTEDGKQYQLKVSSLHPLPPDNAGSSGATATTNNNEE